MPTSEEIENELKGVNNLRQLEILRTKEENNNDTLPLLG